MVTNKRIKLTTVLMAILSVALLACSSVAMAFAEGQSAAPTNFAEFVQEYDQYISDSGLYTEGDPFQSLNDLVNPDESVKMQQASALYTLAYAREEIAQTYSDENLAKTAEPASVTEIKGIRDSALANCKVTGAKINGINWEEYVASLEEGVKGEEAKIKGIFEADANAWQEKVESTVNAIVDKYNALLAVTNAGAGNENTTVGYYSPAQELELKKVFESYVAQNQETYALVNSVEYNAPQIGECKAALEAIENQAIKALESVAVNEIEIAYNAYNDWIELKQGNTNTPEYEAAVKQLKLYADRAIEIYEKSASAEIQAEYAAEYAILVQFVADPYQPWELERKSVLTDSQKVITIKAVYKDGSEASVIPEYCELVIYQSANGSAKRSATKAIKGINEELSVAYFANLRIENVVNGVRYKYFYLPETDDNGRAVEYQVTVNLNDYYTKYCEEQGLEKDKLQNITDAKDLIASVAEASLCYTYSQGKVTNLDYTLEGGVLVFTTTAHLYNFCVAGAGLDNLLANPIFWVIVLAALIVLIIIAKIIAKNVRYSIKFITNGGTPVSTVKAAKGEYFVMPEEPTKDGYVFAGWFTDKDLTIRFLDTCILKRKNIKLYAKWASPLEKSRLIEMYDALRDLMRSYKKESFKSLLGLTEVEMLACMYFNDSHIQLNLALNPDDLKKEGIKVTTSKERKFAEVPAQINISTEELYALALELVQRAILAKGLQKDAEYETGAPSTEEERQNGFVYMIRNDRVASTAEDYFELLRIALKSYVMEEDNGKFKPGDKVTLARIYITNEVACLHLPSIKGDKALKPSRDARFEDTPVVVKILAPSDMIEAYALIEKVMKSNGFVKCPENANDLMDVVVPATNGFAYTIVF